MKAPFSVTLKDVQKAQKVLSPYLRPSPLLLNAWLSDAFGCEVYLKLESMQPIGSFKIRGATYRISHLTSAEKKRGVIAASAGNHAQGVAWGSKEMGTHATIVMPVGAPLVKIQNTRALGAEVVLKGNTYEESYEEAQRIGRKTHRIFIHAYEDKRIISGQGTIGLEILNQLPKPDFVIGAIGGGGMMSGVSVVLKALSPRTQIVGCQSAGANAMIQSIQQGKAIRLKTAQTFADGIAVKSASETMRNFLSPRIDRWIQVDEDSIAASVLTLLEKGKILAEGSGAVPLSALEQLRKEIQGRKVVLLISGGNIDVNVLSRIIDLGLVRTGRRIRLNVVISDRTGSLARLTTLIAQQGANILQSIHDRNEPLVGLGQTEVALTLETRGPEHSRLLIEALKTHVYHLELVH